MNLPMRFERTISLGNIISGLALLAGLLSGYTFLQAGLAQNTKDVTELKVRQETVERDIYSIHTDIAVIKVQLIEINKKLDHNQ